MFFMAELVIDYDVGSLIPDLHSQNFRLWTNMYCRWEREGLCKQDTVVASTYMKTKSANADRQRRNLLELVCPLTIARNG